MINGLKQLKNLSIPHKLIRAMIIKLFQAKVKLGQGNRASKTQAIENLYKTDVKTKQEIKKMTKLAEELGERQRVANELHKQFRKPKQLRKNIFPI